MAIYNLGTLFNTKSFWRCGNVIMSGYEGHSLDDGRAEGSRSYPEGIGRGGDDGGETMALGVRQRHSYKIKARIRD